MHRLITTIATLSVCALASCASPPPPPPATAGLGSTEGTITFSGGAVESVWDSNGAAEP